MARIWVPQVIASLMLLLAIAPMPYGYYGLLRWICCAVFAFLAVQAHSQKLQGWMWILGVTAGIYNPIFRVYLTRELWTVVNVITIGIALSSISALRQKAVVLDGAGRGSSGEKA